VNKTANKVTIRTAPASHGVAWLVDSFAIFSKNWLAWIGVVIFIFVMKIATLFLPFIGSIAMQILTPVFIGGLMFGCQAADRGEGFVFEHLFAGFSNEFLRLALIGVIQLAGTFLIFIVCGVILFFLVGGMETLINIYHALQSAVAENDINRLIEVSSGMTLFILVDVLIGLALYVPLLVLIWFAPALIILDNQDIISAMKNSFTGCMNNVIPYLVYGVIGLIFCILASIPLGLGWLVLIPMMIISVYLAYKDIYIKVKTESGQAES